MRFFQRMCVLLTSLSIVGVGLPAVSYAGIIDTATAINVAQGGAAQSAGQATQAAGQRAADLAAVRAGLERQEVRERMIALGVDRGLVDARVAALTDEELHSLAGRMEQLPAGGDLLAVIGIVFVVLLVLELVGVIDIFKKA